jgi:hypothetical protein
MASITAEAFTPKPLDEDIPNHVIVIPPVVAWSAVKRGARKQRHRQLSVPNT